MPKKKKETVTRKKTRTIIKTRKTKITIVFICLKLPPTGFAGSTGKEGKFICKIDSRGAV